MKNPELKRNALEQLQQKRFKEALDTCEKYCKKSKGDPEGFLILGLIHGAVNDFVRAVECLDRAAKLGPKIPHVHFNLGVAQRRLGDLEGAHRSLSRAVQLNGDFFEARYNLADVCRELGRVDDALAQYSAAVALKSDYPPLYLNMGNLLRLREDYEGATRHLNDAIRLAPAYYEAHVSLGQTQFRQGRMDDAVKTYERAVTLDPDRSEAYMELGLAAHERSTAAEARVWLEKAVALSPGDARAHYNLAVVLRELDAIDMAATHFQRAIERDPRHTEAYMGLALIQRDLGALDLAHATLGAAAAQDPNKAELYSELGNLKAMLGDLAGALQEHRKAVGMAPERAAVHQHLANMLMQHSQYDEALAEFDAALALAGDEAARQGAIAGKARIGARRGQYEEAYRLIEPLLGSIVHPAIAQVFGMVAEPLGMSTQAMACIEEVLSKPSVALEYKIDLNFQLGKLCDKRKDYDRAFQHYVAGNRYFAERSSDLIARYRPEDQEAYFARLREGFTEAFFARAPTSNCRSERPVFVVGMPHSGTTLTESILCSHPEVFGAGELSELAVLRNETEQRSGRPFPQSLDQLGPSDLDKLADRYLATLESKHATATRVVDKMPHNFLYLGFIALLFPQARIIHIRRDPIDTCLSIFFQKFNVAHAYANDLRWLGQYYRLYADLMAHWNRVLPVPVLNLRYDELVADQESLTREMVQFCGLDWDAACLAFHAQKRDVATPSYDQVSRPIYRDSSGRWKNYARHIGALIDTLRREGVLRDEIV